MQVAGWELQTSVDVMESKEVPSEEEKLKKREMEQLYVLCPREKIRTLKVNPIYPKTLKCTSHLLPTLIQQNFPLSIFSNKPKIRVITQQPLIPTNYTHSFQVTSKHLPHFNP